MGILPQNAKVFKCVTFSVLFVITAGVIIYCYYERRKQTEQDNEHEEKDQDIPGNVNDVCSSNSEVFLSAVSSLTSADSSADQSASAISLCESTDDSHVSPCSPEMFSDPCSRQLLSFDEQLYSPVVVTHEEHIRRTDNTVDNNPQTENAQEHITQRDGSNGVLKPRGIIEEYSDTKTTFLKTIDKYHDLIKPNSPSTLNYIGK